MNQSKPDNARTKIFDELMLFFENILAPYLDERFGGVETRLDKVETRLDKVETRLGGVEEDLGEVKNELKIVNRKIDILQETTPNRIEFTDHEKRITALEKSAFSA